MLNQSYCSEIESLLIQFISAMDDGRIRRPSKEKEGETEYIIPRWIVGNKTRVFADVINQAGNITLPCAVVQPDSISLAKDRLFNKQLEQRTLYANKEYRYRQPTPVDIKVTVNFYTKYFNDIWQMMSNFVAYYNPYIFISWQTPGDLPYIEELRCKVTWSGDFSLDYPKQLNETDKWIITGTASFTLEAWLFEQAPIGNNVITSVHNKLGASGYTVSTSDNENEIDYYIKDGWPSLTNIIVDNVWLEKKLGTTLSIENNKIVIFEGRSFFKEQCTGVLIKPVSTDIQLDNLMSVSIDTIKMGKISGYAVTDNIIDINDNIIKLRIPDTLPNNLVYDIIIYNNAGYVEMSKVMGYNFKNIKL